MSRTPARFFALAWLVVGLAHGGCTRGCGGAAPDHAQGAATSTGATAAAPLPRYFPLGRGDRWRTRGGSDGTMPRVFGVTGVDSGGIAVIFGGASSTPERYRASPTEVARVDENGRTLVPLLRAPLVAGASWSYALRERGVSVPCDARVVRVDAAPRSVLGVRLAGCVTVHRVCRYPVGTPFPQATTHTQDETYCPNVGVVEETQRFSPPPAPGLLPPQTTEHLVAWNVAGGPLPAARAMFDCDEVLLLPSDVQAACGAGLAPLGERTGTLEDGACVFRFSANGRSVAVEVRHASAASARPLTPVGPAPGPAEPSIIVQTARTEVRVRGCDDSRLAPLFQSLFP